ncbi:cutinase family protein [Nocardioides humilatus]|nr:cutinase family protein [Nocardioides humilatus]
MNHTDIRYAALGMAVDSGGGAEFHGRLTDVLDGVSSQGYLDATNVDWGDPSGPSPWGEGYSTNGTVIFTPWVGYVAPPRPPTAPGQVLEEDDCTDVLFIGVRGSGEAPQGENDAMYQPDGINAFGEKIWPTYTEFTEAIAQERPGTTVRPVGLEYRALGVAHNPISYNHPTYLQSIYQGVDVLKNLLASEHNRCAEEPQKVVLAGYSQGALVIRLAIADLERTNSPLLSTDFIGGIILLADPAKTSQGDEWIWDTANSDAPFGIWNAEGIWSKFAEDRNPIPPWLVDRTISMCHDNDIVCAPGWGSGGSQHTNYSIAESESLGRWSAEWLAGRL